ncbi:ATP-binding protein [Bacillus sp. JJ1609]
MIGQGDQQRLTQLLYILLDNALIYTPNGGEVGLTLFRNPKELTIEVLDTGIGIRHEEHHLIFERFYRADEARSRQLGSYGLGLSIAKWIVDIHNGTIDVQSEFGKGSTFIVKIPFFIKNYDKA